MFLGADFPPPIGFCWIVLLILDLIQYKYLQYLLPKLRIRKKKLFIKNLLFFAIGGMLVSIFSLVIEPRITLKQGMSWIIIITIVGAIYGGVFWFLSLFFIKVFRE